MSKTKLNEVRRMQEIAGILKENEDSSNIDKLYSRYEYDCESNGLSLDRFQNANKVSDEQMKAILTRVRKSISDGEVEPFHEPTPGDLKVLKGLGFEDLIDPDFEEDGMNEQGSIAEHEDKDITYDNMDNLSIDDIVKFLIKDLLNELKAYPWSEKLSNDEKIKLCLICTSMSTNAGGFTDALEQDLYENGELDDFLRSKGIDAK